MACEVCVHVCQVRALHLSADATLHRAMTLLLISLCEKERPQTRLTDFILELFHHFTPSARSKHLQQHKDWIQQSWLLSTYLGKRKKNTLWRHSQRFEALCVKIWVNAGRLKNMLFIYSPYLHCSILDLWWLKVHMGQMNHRVNLVQQKGRALLF